MKQPQSSAAQQIIPVDQLVHSSKFQSVGRYNNIAKIVRRISNANQTICFMVYKEDITYTMDMFRATLKIQVETPKQSFIPPADFDYIKPFLRILSYQGSLDKQKKNVIQHPCITKLIIIDLMEKFKSIPKRLEEDYQTIKDDTSLLDRVDHVSVSCKGG
nr:hypothetical protein [Tanacetum cinerariifolium]